MEAMACELQGTETGI